VGRSFASALLLETNDTAAAAAAAVVAIVAMAGDAVEQGVTMSSLVAAAWEEISFARALPLATMKLFSAKEQGITLLVASLSEVMPLKGVLLRRRETVIHMVERMGEEKVRRRCNLVLRTHRPDFRISNRRMIDPY
jgi:hypothetical protein